MYALLLAAAWRWQERMVWQPPAVASRDEPGTRRLTYTAEDGQPLHAYLAGDVGRSPGLLIAFHGNAEIAAWNVSWAAEVARRTGWAVLVPEYRGYAGLPGVPSYEASRRDARAAYRFALDQLGADSSRVALYGHSLGTAIAAELASEHLPAALILLAPFTSARDMARSMLARPVSAMWGMIGRVHFDTRARVAALEAPVSVAHGERDGVIPVRMGRQVYGAARVRGELLTVAGAGHNDVLDVGARQYWRWLGDALMAAAAARTPP